MAIPLHKLGLTCSDITGDLALGLLEPVPLNVPLTWCHRMVITRKDDGGPRRTVDLSSLNKYCLREVHINKPPFELAHGVPAGT